MPDLSVPNSEQCFLILRQTPGILRNLLSDATPEQLAWRPSAERWSIAMVLAHLGDVEIRGFRSRFQAMLAEDQPVLPAYEPWDLFRTRTEFDAGAELSRLDQERSTTLALFESMPHGAGQRSGRHAELGIITVAQLLNEFAFHDLGHIRQVMELYRSHVFYPEMGVYQGFYKINP